MGNMIGNYELEKQILAAFLQKPDFCSQFLPIIDESDFYDKNSLLHKSIFFILKTAIEKSEYLDEITISQRIRDLGITFEEDINLVDYIRSLSMRKIPSDKSVESSIRELKKISVRRQISNTGYSISKEMENMPSDISYKGIVEKADQIYNSKINLFETGDNFPVNIFEEMEDFIEERGNNPVTEFGMMGPHQKINDIYGSLLRPGNITVIVARSGVGKSTFCMDYCTKVSLQYDAPILHFDNGEMSKEELIIRQCAALSGVPAHLLETGEWRKAGEDIVKKVRSTWSKIKNLKFYYYNVGGMDVDSMINAIRRFYYSKVGRGNEMVFSFDYIKTTFENSNKSEWIIVGEMVDKIKRCVQREILEDNKPMISVITSVQSNRSGITNNRNSSQIVDNESIVSLSDRINQFCSHMFILRNKTPDEIMDEDRRFGTHKLINIKHRHLGKDIAGAIEPIRIDDQLRSNFINLEFSNFNIEEKGDLRDIVAFRNSSGDLESVDSGDIPSLEDL